MSVTKTEFSRHLDNDTQPDRLSSSVSIKEDGSELVLDLSVDSTQDIYRGESDKQRAAARKEIRTGFSKGKWSITSVTLEDYKIKITAKNDDNNRVYTKEVGLEEVLPETNLKSEDSRTIVEKRRLIEKIQEMGVTLVMEKGEYESEGGFTLPELRDIYEVLERYRSKIGDLRRFDIHLDVYRYRDDTSCDSEFTEQGPITKSSNPMCAGPAFSGMTDMKEEGNLEITMATKKLLDATHEWKVANDLQPEGQKGRKHDFRWTLIHEIAHQISYRMGFGYKMKDITWNIKGQKYSRFVKAWYKLSKEIRKKCARLQKGSDGDWENKRPEGYPTKYSYFGDSAAGSLAEIWVDTVAYILTDSHYADEDEWFMKRVDLTKKQFETIKNYKP